LPNSTLAFVKRSLGLTRTYSILGAFFAGFGIFVLGALVIFAPDTQFFLFAAAFSSFGILFFVTPIILLYVYDKNNGVLEYLLALGWNQNDIFKRYLKASLLLAFVVFIAEFAIVLILSVIAGSTTIIIGLLVMAIVASLSFTAISLTTIAMIAFSSLQKQRVGANSPLALTIGVVIIIPTFYIPFIFPFAVSIFIDLLIAGLAGALTIVLLVLSSRLIRREKMLP